MVKFWSNGLWFDTKAKKYVVLQGLPCKGQVSGRWVVKQGRGPKQFIRLPFLAHPVHDKILKINQIHIWKKNSLREACLLNKSICF